MKDLDFDELDRAVNTLMGSVPKSDDAKSDETKVVSITPTLSEPVPPTASPTAAPLAARRGGRFMDVVHSSSDMKKDKTASSSISRQGATIQPTTSVVSPEASKPAPAPAQKAPELPKEETISTPDTSSTSRSDWPDPLEMADFSNSESASNAKSEEPSVSDLVSLSEKSEQDASSMQSDDLQPLSSPFLTDAKVEKRPLGGATTESAPEPDHTPVLPNLDIEGTINDPADQLPPSAEESKKELPPEYQGDLVAIESGAAETTVPAQDTKTEEKKTEEAAKTVKPETHPTALLEAKNDDEPVVTGPTSIVQQYKEEPSTGDQHNGAIYDTEAYHKPLAHPAKKKSGWMVVVWILVILVVGAGAGAGLYFLGIF